MTVNGSPRELAEGATLAELLAELGVARAGIAIAVNERVVRGASFDEHHLHDGDAIEIIRAVAGG
ncbi:MAG TPA: sulfur carrier protein ThiS [Candidatus Baltobacteraceae bacterium]